MSKKEHIKLSVEQLLEKERNKNRRIVTGVLIAVALVVGVIGGYFLSINVISQANATVVNSITLKASQ